ncbi:MAG: right-handed parallel beta-helix repeat-containing protein [Alcanivoracaceae bacterium]|nr:right-handed parallel beta-helix repeat-containing protein [Alcanivoracaceae bacterium]
MKIVTTLAITLLALCATAGHAQTFEVNSLRGDSDLNDEIITLADAVIIANTIPGPDKIVFSPDLKGTITLKQQLEITESLEIAGPGASVLTLYLAGSSSTYSNRAGIFVVSDATASFSLSGLKLKRNISDSPLPRPVSSFAATNLIENLVLENFQTGINLNRAQSATLKNLEFVQCRALAEVTTQYSAEAINSTVIIENVTFRSPAKTTSRSYALTLYKDTGNNASYAEDEVSVIVDGLRVTDTNFFGVLAVPESRLDVMNSSFDNNNEFMMTATNADVRIENTTIYNNTVTSILFRENTTAEVAFSTIFYNGGRDGGPVIAVDNSSLDIDHSVVTITQNAEQVIRGSDSFIDVTFSMLGITSVPSGSPINYDAVSLANLLRFPQFEGALESADGRKFAIIPASPGNLFDAGDGSAVAGLGGVPALDQIGSIRIIGSAPDIGATEYNRPPQFDVDAFKVAIKEAIAATPEGLIEIDLLDYFSDPDGHNIIDLKAYNLSEGLAFDAGTWILSGTAEALARPALVAVATDEYQLEGGAAVGTTVSAGGGDSGGAPAALLLLLSTLIIRRRSANPVAH